MQSGREWIVDAGLKDFFGPVDHAKLLTLIAQRVADGRVLRLLEAMLKAGSYGQGRLFPSQRGTPQGSVVSPLLSNILLTPFDQEMRSKGFQLTRFADDWVITCYSEAEAHAAIAAALRILKALGVELHPRKTRVIEPLDRATDLVASIQAMAQSRLARAARSNAVQRQRAGQPYSVNPLACLSQQRLIVKAAYGKTVRAV